MIKFIRITFFAATLLTVCCAERLPGIEEVKARLSSFSDLAVLEYKVNKIVYFDDSTRLGNKFVLYKVTAVVKAGIDLDKLEIQHIDKEEILLKLPEPAVLSINIPIENIEKLSEDVGFLRFGLTQKDKDKILSKGQSDIERKVKELEILEDARKNTEQLLRSWLRILGFNRITFV